ncbi:FAD-dependent monooxygenase [Mycobacteroides abscessus]|uniref:FAD-dependent monooxygenase n=1 Tax=Mycobacteroides abscessus TaxID=36809 RepID=UPI0002FCE2FA|nr:FAD-dependent monooxygenase [Mycobacteroides abscessus]UEA47070.1 FAD-dependent monooxygenase [Mycobacteroides abscessus subsp. abscessus]UEA52955.1 FAD-dependent monooxygenase [Mycobacteroides abscessus]SHT48201.1 salicylate hydroxylase [Mycobacteroides abscessus subsp. bolletii]SHW41662.1 salicylate hydroxylase [Mycobacteroides abscessus subsp. bolletii]SHW77746.1 salicylate hydroxylase [Mycobacteroides abscessus subsp. bolletii]
MRVAIIGAGIGGLTAAAALRANDIDVIVYEKAHELREVGAGVVIANNGLRALDEVGLGDRVRSVGTQIRRTLWHTWQGESVPVPPAWPAVSPDRPVTSLPVHRGELQHALLGALPAGTVQLGRPCQDIVETADEVRIIFADGSEERADVAVGADGIHSAVQRVVADPVELSSDGIMAYRGLIPVERLDGVIDLNSMQMWLGPGRSFLIYPVSRGRLLNVVAFTPSNLDAEESWTAPGDVAELSAQFAGWDEPVQRVAGAMTETFRWGLYDRKPLNRWTTDRIALLGDAAHPMTPHLGQGANMSIEDAVVLATVLAGASATEVPRRLSLYESLRRDRTSRVQRNARQSGRVYRSVDLTAQQQAAQLTEILADNWIPDYDAAATAGTALATL